MFPLPRSVFGSKYETQSLWDLAPPVPQSLTSHRQSDFCGDHSKMSTMQKGGNSFSSYALRASSLPGTPIAEQRQRGMGPHKKAAALPLQKLATLSWDVAPLCNDGPINPWGLIVRGSYFLTRELELSCARKGHLTVDESSLTVTRRLPASKTDVEGIGVARSWGCVCEDNKGKSLCPYHQACFHLQLLTTCEKEQVVQTLIAAARRANEATEDEIQATPYGCQNSSNYKHAGPQRVADSCNQDCNNKKLEELSAEVAKISRTVHAAAVTQTEGDMASLNAKVEELARVLAKRERDGASSR
eukprot:4320955-Amphidinium_carterae.1